MMKYQKITCIEDIPYDFPVHISEKLDGVPAEFRKRKGSEIEAYSRQGKPIHSVSHIVNLFKHSIPDGGNVIGELYIEGKPFKDISGLVRRKVSCEETKELNLFVFDYYEDGKEDVPYELRMSKFWNKLHPMVLVNEFVQSGAMKILSPYSTTAKNIVEAREFIEGLDKCFPNNEGVIIRSTDGAFQNNKRSWNVVKMKKTLEMDMVVHSFEEALDKNGVKKGMVGRINAFSFAEFESTHDSDYPRYEVVGVGPGKLTHAERTELWNNRHLYKGRIFEATYMPDGSYDALREARFYRWREDHDT